jgi:hydroxymethylglutaryl-CoA lyase
MTQPMTQPMTERQVTIYEVGPRDGLQNEQGVVPVADKAAFIRRLLAAGLPVVEATSFVHPKWVPQLADAAELTPALVEQLSADYGFGVEGIAP